MAEYLMRIGGICYKFEDAPVQVIDNSFTLSYDSVNNNWAFFHDYIPDAYIQTRASLLLSKRSEADNNRSKIYLLNAGERGKYFDNSVKPFFLDVVFRYDSPHHLDSIQWISEVRDSGNLLDDKAPLYDETISAITIWNANQCSGRIEITKEFIELYSMNSRNTDTVWSFNEFRDIAIKNIMFLDTIFKDFAVLHQGIDHTLEWFEMEPFIGTYFIVRIEFNNELDRQITISDITANTTKLNTNTGR